MRTEPLQQSALDVRAEEDAILEQYARAKALAAEAKQLEAEAKERALALCSALKRSTLSSDAGVLSVSDVAGARRFSPEKARQFLTAEQYEECFELGKPSIRVQFTAARRGK